MLYPFLFEWRVAQRFFSNAREGPPQEHGEDDSWADQADRAYLPSIAPLRFHDARGIQILYAVQIPDSYFRASWFLRQLWSIGTSISLSFSFFLIKRLDQTLSKLANGQICT